MDSLYLFENSDLQKHKIYILIEFIKKVYIVKPIMGIMQGV